MNPLDDAQARLMKMIVAEAAQPRVMQEVGAIVASWADEPEITPSLVRWRIEKLWDTFTTEAADLQAAISNEEAADPVLAWRVMSAMNATMETLEKALG